MVGGISSYRDVLQCGLYLTAFHLQSENERMMQPQATVQSSSSRPKTEYAMAHNMVGSHY